MELDSYKNHMVENTNRMELTMTKLKANAYSLIFLILAIIAFGLPYYLVWGNKIITDFLIFINKLRNMAPSDTFFNIIKVPLLTLLAILSGTFLHELIHGITLGIFAKGGFKTVKLGVMWRALTPYTHCNEPLPVNNYRLAIVMPGLILGIIPAIIGTIVGVLWLTILGIFFTWAAGGDFMLVWLLRKVKSVAKVQDHPKELGCYVIECE